MISGNLKIKHPDDTVTTAIDFSSLLAPGETIVTLDSVTPSPNDLTVGGSSIVGSTVQIELDGGTLGSFYSIIITVETSTGNILSDSLMILVQDCSWLYEMIRIERYLSGDLLAPVTTPDSNMGEIILISALQVLAECTFVNNYTVSVGTLTLTPDPTNPNTRDNAFINLVCLKSACLLDLAALRNKAGLDGILVRDNMGTIQTSNSTQGYKDLLNSGPCGQYKAAIKQYKFGNIGGNWNRAIIGPASGPSITVPYMGWAGSEGCGLGHSNRNFGFF